MISGWSLNDDYVGVEAVLGADCFSGEAGEPSWIRSTPAPFIN